MSSEDLFFLFFNTYVFMYTCIYMYVYIYMCIYIIFSPSLLTTVLAAGAFPLLAMGATRAASILPCSCILHQQYKYPASPKSVLQQLPHKLLHKCSLLPFCSSSQGDSGSSCPPGSSHCLSILSHSLRNPLPSSTMGHLHFPNGADHFNLELMGTCLWIWSPR